MNIIHVRSFLIGVASAVPFLALNFAVVTGFQPVVSFLRPEGGTTGFEQWTIFVLLAIAFAGGIVALWPMLKRDERGKRAVFLANAVVGAFLVLSSVSVAWALGMETYRCDVLEIPNCD